jgi:8-oxo-dGTP pyrophosphatase MutT (NUDIX family)
MRKTAIALVFSPDKSSILAIKRRDIPIWVFPGGGIEDHESPENAAIREVLEETGLVVKTTHKIAEYSPTNCLTSEMHIYECTYLEGAPHKTSETRAAGFFPVHKLPKPFFLLHTDILKDYFDSPQKTLYKPVPTGSWFRVLWYGIRNPLLMTRFLLVKSGFSINTKD